MSDISHTGMDDNALLHLAVIEENQDVVRFLLKHGVPVNGRAVNKQLALEFLTDSEHQLHTETALGDLVNTSKCDELGEDRLDVFLSKTTTALHLACRQESKSMAEHLVMHGADVNAEMEGGETPLIVAVLSKQQSIVDLLLERGADPNARTAWGKTPLHYTAQTGQKNIAESLLKHEAQVNSANLEGLTPLHVAAEAGNKDVVVVLLKNGADVDLRTKAGATVLHYAAVMGHKDVVETILNHGADINILMKHGGLDLSPFKWITPAEEKKTWELISKYTTKMSILNWYNTMVMKLYKKSKERKSLLQSEAEHQHQQQQQQ